MMNDLLNGSYFERLDLVQEAVSARLQRAKAVIAPDFDLFGCALMGPVNYGETIRVSLPLSTLKDKPTRKAGQVVIARTCGGNYELTFYIL